MTIVEDFLEQETLAVAGVSRSGGGYGVKVWRHLRARGVQVYALNPHGGVIDGEPIYAGVRELPQMVGGIVTVTPPEATLAIVKDCIKFGIPRVWMQPGSENQDAIKLAEEHGLDVVSGQCMLMA